MNLFGFIALMREIYGKKLPDLERIKKRGLLAVKIAQHFALRIDFLDEKVCRHLAGLFRAADPAEAENFDAIAAKWVSRAWYDAFQSIEQRPFASASVGQVHRAVLVSGESVVVKVIRDEFKTAFLRDLRDLRRSLKLVLFFAPLLKKVFNPLAILDHIEEYTLQELDLRSEMAGAHELRTIQDRYRSRYPLEKLAFPRHYETLSSESVLVAQYVEGSTLDALLDAKTLTYEHLLELFSLHGLFLFGAGRFHGDLHPGNVIRGKNGTVWFVDTGALSGSGERIRTGLFRFFTALSAGDFDKAADALHAMSLVSLKDFELARFRKRFAALYADFPGKTVSEVSLTRKMMETIKMGVYCGMAFDQGMFPVIKSLMYLDGMVLRCNPNAKLIEDMRPFIETFERVMNNENL